MSTVHPASADSAATFAPIGQTATDDVVDAGNVQSQLKDLRGRIDALRAENQALRLEVERHKNARFLVRALALSGRRIVRRSMKQLTARFSESDAPVENGHFHQMFKPYQVRSRQPPFPVRPRVLHVIANVATGGSTRLIVDLIEHLGHRFEQIVLTKDLPSRAEYTGADIRATGAIRNQRQAQEILDQIQPDLIHVHYLADPSSSFDLPEWTWYARLFGAAEALGCGVIENVNIPVDPFISSAVDAYVYVSDYVRHAFGSSDRGDLTIYPGIDFDRFTRHAVDPLPSECIGMVYRLQGDKLYERSIDVFIEVLRRRAGTRALIVGGGDFFHTYRAAVAEAGLADRFTFTGYVSYDDLPAYYEQLSIFVAPVHTESFGQVTPFAMHMGIPVVGYRVGALEEILGDPSVLAPAGDRDRLADLIVQLLDDPEHRLCIGEWNRSRAERLFSVESMVCHFDALYDQVLAKNRASVPSATGGNA